MPDEFDKAAWLVRWRYGMRYQCYRTEPTVKVVIARFRGGVMVRHQSLSTALQIATDIKRRDTH